MPQDALVFARQWGDWAWERRAWDEAAEAYARAAKCISKLLREHIDDETTRISMLQELSCITRGAFAYCENGQDTDAVLLLERANHFFYSVHEDAQALRRLQQIAPDLVTELLAVLTPTLPYEQRFDTVGRLLPEEQSRLARKDTLVHQVRTHSGFESFATAPDWQSIQSVAREQPLLYLFTCEYGGKAIFIGEHSDHSLHCATVALDLSTETLRDLLQPFLRAEFERTGSIDVSAAALETMLDRVEAIAGNAITALRTLFGLQDRAMTCIPIGLVALAPWHARLAHVSYAYSARSLRRCLQGAAASAVIDHACAVDNPRPLPPEYDPLLLSAAEAAIIAEHFPTTILSGIAATRKNVVEMLPQAALVHMSCHGTIDQRFGYSSVLLLANREILNSQQLREMPGLRARLVVLSACATGILALSTEQTLTMPFHFLGAGANAVIATMWHTDETATLVFVQAFYRAWTETTLPAEALRVARDRVATATAAELRADLIDLPQAQDALRVLSTYAPDFVPFAAPWYWAAFFLAGV